MSEQHSDSLPEGSGADISTPENSTNPVDLQESNDNCSTMEGKVSISSKSNCSDETSDNENAKEDTCIHSGYIQPENLPKDLVFAKTPGKVHVVRNRRLKQETVVWEPLLVPTEVDGKVEMVTALKRVDANVVRGISAKKQILHAEKESNLPHSPKTATSGISMEVSNLRESKECKDQAEKKNKATNKKSMSIIEKMGKTIIEKEAAILKEIDKAMKEAANTKKPTLVSSQFTKKKGDTYNQQLKSKSSPKSAHLVSVAKTQRVPELDMIQILQGPSKKHEDKEKSGTKTVSSSSRIQQAGCTVMMPKTKIITPNPGSTLQHQIHSRSNIGTSPKVITATASLVKSRTNNNQSTRAVLKVPGLQGKVLGRTAAGATVLLQDPKTFAKVLSSPKTLTVNTPKHKLSNNNYQTSSKVGIVPTSREIIHSSGKQLIVTPASMSTNSKTSILSSNVSSSSTSSKSVRSSSCIRLLGRNASDHELKKNLGKGTEVGTYSNQGLPVISSPEKLVDGSKNVNAQTPPPEKPLLLMENQDSTCGDTEVKHVALECSILPIANVSSSNTVESFVKSSDYHSPSCSTATEITPKSEENELIPTAELIKDESMDLDPSSASSELANELVSQRSIEHQIKIEDDNESVDMDGETLPQQSSEFGIKAGVDSLEGSSSRISKHSTKETEESKVRRRALKRSMDDDAGDLVLEKRLQRIEQLYEETSPVQQRLSFTPEEFSELRDKVRDNLWTVKALSNSFKNLIRQSAIDSTERVDASCQTEHVSGENVETDIFLPDDTVVSDGVFCRLCSKSYKKDSVISIFASENRGKKLVSMINKILPQFAPIKESDGLPLQICKGCEAKLTLCNNIINQFLLADEHLKKVLNCEKPLESQTQVTEEEQINVTSRVSYNRSTSTVLQSVSPEERLEELNNVKPIEEEQLNTSRQDVSIHRRQKTKSNVESSARTVDNKATPSHNRKRKRSKSPLRSASSESAPSNPSCIDLSRLDPEFNDGFEVEWCLDEETIRSTLVPEEEFRPSMRGESTVVCLTDPRVNSGTAENLSNKLQRENKDISTRTFHKSSTSQRDIKNNRASATSEIKDEVSKVPEMHTSDRVSLRKYVKNSCPFSEVVQESNCSPSSDDGNSQEHFVCFCSLLFNTEQELVSHQVKLHKLHEKTPKANQLKSKVALSKNAPQKRTSSQETDAVIGRCEETVCDECGMSFPNEISLFLHKCVVHENMTDPQLVIKDSKGLEYKIINENGGNEENSAAKDLLESSEMEKKVLV